MCLGRPKDVLRIQIIVKLVVVSVLRNLLIIQVIGN